MKQFQMPHIKFDDILIALLGSIAGLWGYFMNLSSLLKIDWPGVWNHGLDLLWSAVLAITTGALSVVGKRLSERFFKRKKKNP